MVRKGQILEPVSPLPSDTILRQEVRVQGSAEKHPGGAGSQDSSCWGRAQDK